MSHKRINKKIKGGDISIIPSTSNIIVQRYNEFNSQMKSEDGIKRIETNINEYSKEINLNKYKYPYMHYLYNVNLDGDEDVNLSIIDELIDNINKYNNLNNEINIKTQERERIFKATIDSISDNFNDNIIFIKENFNKHLETLKEKHSHMFKMFDKYNLYKLYDNKSRQKSSKFDNQKKFFGGQSLSYYNPDDNLALVRFCQQYHTHHHTELPQDITLDNLKTNIRHAVFSTYPLNNIRQKINDEDEVNIEEYNLIYHFNSYNTNISQNINEAGINQEYFQRKFYYRTYNKDILLSYERLQADYKQHLDDYLLQQELYINSLSDINKNIIKDYIRPQSYFLISTFISNPTQGFLNRFLANHGGNILTEMGNAFHEYIFLLKAVQGSEIRADIKDEIMIKRYYDNAHDLYTQITEQEWGQILTQYLIDLNVIITGAPELTNPIMCFRGSSNDYIQAIASHAAVGGRNVFVSFNRPSSLSINFDASKFFYDLGGVDKCMYRIIVSPGCKILFITPLAPPNLRHEMEFLIPPYHVFISHNNIWNSEEVYNSINNTNSVCLYDRDKIRSKDLYLINIPRT